MQLMPRTFKAIKPRYALGQCLRRARDNILAGSACHRQMYDGYGFPLLFAAYPAAPGRVDSSGRHGTMVPASPRLYGERIVRRIGEGPNPQGASPVVPHASRRIFVRTRDGHTRFAPGAGWRPPSSCAGSPKAGR